MAKGDHDPASRNFRLREAARQTGIQSEVVADAASKGARRAIQEFVAMNPPAPDPEPAPAPGTPTPDLIQAVLGGTGGAAPPTAPATRPAAAAAAPKSASGMASIPLWVWGLGAVGLYVALRRGRGGLLKGK